MAPPATVARPTRHRPRSPARLPGWWLPWAGACSVARSLHASLRFSSQGRGADGQFDLMNYRITAPTKPLLWVEANVSRPSRSRVEYTVKLKTQFKARLNATGVEIKLPVPGDATAPEVKAALGAVTYAPEQEAMLWKIKTVPGGKEVLMRAKFSLPSVAALEDDGPKQKKPPITVKYEIPYFTVSGVQVRYLKVIEKSGYQALPWVRYITRSGNYEFRLAHQPAT